MEFLWGATGGHDKNMPKLDHADGCITVNTLIKTTEVCALNEWTLWYVNYVSIKLVFKKSCWEINEFWWKKSMQKKVLGRETGI